MRAVLARAALASTLALATLTLVNSEVDFYDDYEDDADVEVDPDADEWSAKRLHGPDGSLYSLDAGLTLGEGLAASARVTGQLGVYPMRGMKGGTYGREHGRLMLLQFYATQETMGLDKHARSVGRDYWAVKRQGGNISVWLSESDSNGLKNVKRGIGAAVAAAGVWKESGTVEGPWGLCGVSSPNYTSTSSEGPLAEHYAVVRCGMAAQRVLRYVLGDKGRMETLEFEEMVSITQPAVPAYSWLHLQRLPQPPEKTIFWFVPPHLPRHDMLVEPVLPYPKGDGNDVTQLEKIVSTLVAGEEAGRGGTAELAGAVSTVTEAVHAARGKLKDMVSSCSPSSLNSLLFALGLSGCKDGKAAADSVLQLSTDAAADRAHHYFKGLALAHNPKVEVIMWALETGESARDARIREAAILGAAGAMGRRLRLLVQGMTPDLAEQVQTFARLLKEAADGVLQRLLTGLAKCAATDSDPDSDMTCTTLYLRALGALYHSDGIPALLEHAQRSEPRAAMAALSALRNLHPPLEQPLRPAAQPLLSLALDSPAWEGPRPLEVRAAALSLGTRLAAVHSPAALAVMARALASLRDPLASELRRLFWQLLEQLTAIPAVQELLKELPKDIMAQHMYALNGTSGSMYRAVWSIGGSTAAMAVDAASAGGLLRQLAVRLAVDEGDRLGHALTVEVGARGMHGVAGFPPPPGAKDDEKVESTISMTVLGSPLPTLTLFSEQKALLGALWAGTGSVPTPVLRVTAPDIHGMLTEPLLLGLVVVSTNMGLTAALDGSGVASLSSRTARVTLELRTAIAVNNTVVAHTPWGEITASTSGSANPSLNIAADLDFYSDPILCVRANTPGYELHSNSTWMTSQDSRRRLRFSVTSRPARSLALTKDIHAACRVTHRP